MDFRPRIAATPTTALAAAGDVVCIGLFSAAGVYQHGTISELFRVPEVALPFLVGWLLVGSVVGVFDEDALTTPREAAARAAVAWVGADLVGQGLRATSVVAGGVAPAFFLVSLLVAGTLLVGWRALLSWAVN